MKKIIMLPALLFLMIAFAGAIENHPECLCGERPDGHGCIRPIPGTGPHWQCPEPEHPTEENIFHASGGGGGIGTTLHFWTVETTKELGDGMCEEISHFTRMNPINGWIKHYTERKKKVNYSCGDKLWWI